MLPLTGRALASEGIATAFLLMAIVGSGIMGERLAGGNVAIALLANSLATGAALVALIATFEAHMNPLVTLMETASGRLTWLSSCGYIVAQVIGAVIGVALANLMFGLPAMVASQHVRSGSALALSETIATFGLATVVANVARRAPASVPMAVGAYIVAAYWFTSSTSFANPAVTVARSLTDTFAGIAPAGVPLFVLAQTIGAALAVAVDRGLHHGHV